MKVMCLKVNPVKLLVKAHLVLPFAPVSSKVYPDINKINYSPLKRLTLQVWYLGKDVMNIYPTNTPEITESWPPRESRIVFKCQSSYHLLQSSPCSFSAPSHLSSPAQEHPTFCLNEYTQDSYKEPSIISCNTDERFHMLLCCSRQFTPVVYQGYSLSDATVFKTLLK